MVSTEKVLGGISGCGLGMALVVASAFLVPTEEVRVEKLVAEHWHTFDQTRRTICNIAGAAAETKISERPEAKFALPLGPPRTQAIYSEDLPQNTLLIDEATLQTFKSGEAGEDPYSRGSTFGRAGRDFLEDISALLSPDPSVRFYRVHQVQHVLERMDELRYFVVIRLHKTVAAEVISRKEFRPGNQAASALWFNMRTGEYLGGFRFAASNSDDIRFEQQPPAIDFGRLASELTPAEKSEAESALTKDLMDNLKAAFFEQLKELAPEAR